MIRDVLVWNGRTADPAPAKREALVELRTGKRRSPEEKKVIARADRGRTDSSASSASGGHLEADGGS